MSHDSEKLIVIASYFESIATPQWIIRYFANEKLATSAAEEKEDGWFPMATRDDGTGWLITPDGENLEDRSGFTYSFAEIQSIQKNKATPETIQRLISQKENKISESIIPTHEHSESLSEININKTKEETDREAARAARNAALEAKRLARRKRMNAPPPPQLPEEFTFAPTANDFQDALNIIKCAKLAKTKLDPKAKVRNRGTVCVSAEQAKDKKDHFPINDIDQARNALARVQQYNKVPSWYKGSLSSLQQLVSRKVHSKYPSIGKENKS